MSREKGIRVSENHGVNPSIIVCAWCGEESGVALLGKLPGDAEAPKRCVVNYDPCDKCAETWSLGIPIIEVSTHPVEDNQVPIVNGAYPTGRLIVVKKDAVPDDKFIIGKPTLMIEDQFKELFSRDN